ncbi:MAG: twin-arginine translocase TatA/TatE family subunit [Actinobacteria bacterium]|nr:twin-arginine translocase TatA/TatE family subunit [Actinomycetota bacterium]
MQGPELLIILFIILLLFGAKRMPDMARSLGRSVRILKAETKNDTTKTEEQPKNPEA